MNQVSSFRAFKTVVAMSWRASLRERVFSVVGVLASLLLGASFFFNLLSSGQIRRAFWQTSALG